MSKQFPRVGVTLKFLHGRDHGADRAKYDLSRYYELQHEGEKVLGLGYRMLLRLRGASRKVRALNKHIGGYGRVYPEAPIPPDIRSVFIEYGIWSYRAKVPNATSIEACAVLSE